MGSSMTIEEPETEEAKGAPAGEDSDGDDEDRPGWLITYTDGKQPEVIRTEDMYDEAGQLSFSEEDKAEVLEHFDKACKGGSAFFALGSFRGNMALIRSFCWSEDVDLPEIAVFDSLQERIEALLESVEEAGRGIAFMSQQQNALLQAQAALFQSIEAEDEAEDEDEDEEPEAAPAPAAPVGRPLRTKGKGGKLPPGFRR